MCEKTNFVKQNVSKHEYIMQKHVYDLDILNVPRIISYDENSQTMVMEGIKGMNISDMYGENIENVPDEIFGMVQIIIKKLKRNNIEYPDITGYNFIEDRTEYSKIWVIDFEHSKINNNITNPYIISICDNNVNEWNPEFK